MNRKVFIGSIPVSASKQEVLDYFQQKAEVASFSVIVKRKNKNFICGILQCKDEKNAKRILSTGHFFKGTQLECHPFMRGHKLKSYKTSTMKKNVYVANIPYNSSKSEIKKVFLSFGKVEKIRFLHSHRIKEKYCIVSFEEEESAEAALAAKKIAAFGGFVKIKKYKSNKNTMKKQINEEKKTSNQQGDDDGEQEYIRKSKFSQDYQRSNNYKNKRNNEGYQTLSHHLIHDFDSNYDDRRRTGDQNEFRDNNDQLNHYYEKNNRRSFNPRINPVQEIQVKNSHWDQRRIPDLRFSEKLNNFIFNSTDGMNELTSWVRTKYMRNEMSWNHQGNNIRLNQRKRSIQSEMCF